MWIKDGYNVFDIFVIERYYNFFIFEVSLVDLRR